MKRWIAALVVVSSAVAGSLQGCGSSGSNPFISFDSGSDATQRGDDASDDASGACGAQGEACCTGQTCQSGLDCQSGTCSVPGGDDGGGNDGSMGGDDSGGGQDGAGGHDASGHDAGGGDSGKGDGGGGHDAGDAGAADCGSTPRLFLEDAGKIYCGYGDAGALYCASGNECCLGGSLGNGTYGAETCKAFGAKCTNGGEPDAGGSPAVPIECMQVSDCAANGVKAVACCLQGATTPSDGTCTYPKAVGGTAVVCEKGSGSAPAACKSTETNLCSSQADCPSGTTCTPGKWKIFDVGFCL